MGKKIRDFIVLTVIAFLILYIIPELFFASIPAGEYFWGTAEARRNFYFNEGGWSALLSLVFLISLVGIPFFYPLIRRAIENGNQLFRKIVRRIVLAVGVFCALPGIYAYMINFAEDFPRYSVLYWSQNWFWLVPALLGIIAVIILPSLLFRGNPLSEKKSLQKRRVKRLQRLVITLAILVFLFYVGPHLWIHPAYIQESYQYYIHNWPQFVLELFQAIFIQLPIFSAMIILLFWLPFYLDIARDILFGWIHKPSAKQPPQSEPAQVDIPINTVDPLPDEKDAVTAHARQLDPFFEADTFLEYAKTVFYSWQEAFYLGQMEPFSSYATEHFIKNVQECNYFDQDDPCYDKLEGEAKVTDIWLTQSQSFSDDGCISVCITAIHPDFPKARYLLLANFIPSVEKNEKATTGCPNCGAPIDGSAVCKFCGSQLTEYLPLIYRWKINAIAPLGRLSK